MTGIQILLLIAGAVIFALGFILPVGKDQDSFDTAKGKKEYSARLKELTDAELREASRKVRDIIDEEVFMYDMLNDKTTDLKNTIRKYENMEKASKEVKKPAPRTETSENIHIPKMFAAPGAVDGKNTGAQNAAAMVNGKYGKEIIRLHKAGVSDIDIAKRLGIGVGEVRLAISLNDNGAPNEA